MLAKLKRTELELSRHYVSACQKQTGRAGRASKAGQGVPVSATHINAGVVE